MKMIPPYVKEELQSKAECRVFEDFKRSRISDDYICFHSVNLPEHLYKVCGEIDFLVISKSGILVLEVKGGGVSRRDGIWIYQDRWGVKHHNSEGPFKQANSAMFSLRERLKKLLKSSEYEDLTFGYGVIFPDCCLLNDSLEWSKEQILDGVNWTVEKVERFVIKLYKYWHNKCPNKPANVSQRLIDHLASIVRGDFDQVIGLGILAEQIEAKHIRLTREQYLRLDAIQEAPRILIRGGAGTGKTLLATEVARQHVCSGQRVLLICFSPLLASYLRSQIELNNLSIHSLHQLMLGYLYSQDRIPDGYTSGMPITHAWFGDVLIPTFESRARNLSEDEQFDVMIIDEGQDILNFNCIGALERLLKGGWEEGIWRIFYDPFNQAAVFNAMDLDTINLLKEFGPVPSRLKINCRNTDPIVLHTKLVTGADLASESTGPGPDVVIRFFTDPELSAGFIQQTLEELRDEHCLPAHITILSPVDIRQSCIRFLNIQWQRKIQELSGSGECSWPLTRISYSKIQDFKGLENRYILLTDLSDIFNDPVGISLLYVGMTRASVKLWIVADTSIKVNLDRIMVENLAKLG